ncbi:UDP-3-O-(3-hydroxymyristoyl)glucosamine N-acyltransferase [candidate division WOR-3 bacterium]|nr:UDP-3-O-(3-hydroxymyristoyl)glucosamine N-acyltransferase [candidate division WOR-3 bacterium]MCK4525768.1 UDP-3-O-(3-hydroxymyristoyl)glucosamine N-acyltransferase [candidate division WOR-3 bacterium]
MKIKEIAELINGEIFGDFEYEVERVSEISDAEDGALIFFFDEKNLQEGDDRIKGIAAVVPEGIEECPARSYIKVNDPRLAMIKILNHFYPNPVSSFSGVSKNTHIGDVDFGSDVTIGDFTVIGDGTIIGDRVEIFPFTYIGHNVEIGEGSRIYPHSVILDKTIIGKNVIVEAGAIIGSSGFGYHRVEGRYIPIPQVGRVIIEDEVEIGACSMVDRSTIGATVIRKGTKIDNNVHIAHNVQIGANAIIMAQVGIAGSSTVGDNVVIAGQVGISDHVHIGNGSHVAAKSGVMRDVKDGEVVFGYPADNRTSMMRNEAYFRRLPELFKRVKALENLR